MNPLSPPKQTEQTASNAAQQSRDAALAAIREFDALDEPGDPPRRGV